MNTTLASRVAATILNAALVSVVQLFLISLPRPLVTLIVGVEFYMHVDNWYTFVLLHYNFQVYYQVVFPLISNAQVTLAGDNCVVFAQVFRNGELTRSLFF